MANYRKAPKVNHTESKEKYNTKKVTYVIPQEMFEKLFLGLNGNRGNQLKLITVLLGTIGDGSFGISEEWITNLCHFSQSSYVKARKSLINMGWVTLEKGKIFVNIEKIMACRGEMEGDKKSKKQHETLRCDSQTCHNVMPDTLRRGMYNKEEQINNKEYNTCRRVMDDIIFSRKEDIIILSRDTKLSESELKQIIISSNISDADDFIYFWKKINEEGSDPFGGYKDTKSKSFVLEKYNYYISKDKEYNIGDRLEDADFIIDNDSGHLRDIFFTKNFYMCNLSDEQISELKKLKVATYFFRRNDKNK